MTSNQSKPWRIAFGIALIAPTLLWLLLSSFLPESNNEKREKSPEPDFELANYTNIADEITAYYNDRVPFREALVSLDSYGIYRFFHEPGQLYVIVGKGNWLFYNRPDDGDDLMDYKGLSVFSEEHRQIAMANLAVAGERLEAIGSDFAVLIVPEKDHVYSDKMPSYIYGPGPSQADDFAFYVKTMLDTPIVYPQHELVMFREENPETDIYFHYDTHWNDLGAYLGTKALLNELGIESSSVWELTMNETDNSPYDLAKLLSISPFVHDDVGYEIVDPNAGELTIYNDNDAEWEIMHYAAKGENVDPRTVVVIRDSFGVEMAPYLASHFAETYLVHHDTYLRDFIHDELLHEIKPDLVILELSERYLADLLNFYIEE